MGGKELTLIREDSALYGCIFVTSSKQRFAKMAKEKHRPREKRRFIQLYAHATLATQMQRMQLDLVDSNDCE